MPSVPPRLAAIQSLGQLFGANLYFCRNILITTCKKNGQQQQHFYASHYFPLGTRSQLLLQLHFILDTHNCRDLWCCQWQAAQWRVKHTVVIIGVQLKVIRLVLLLLSSWVCKRRLPSSQRTASIKSNDKCIDDKKRYQRVLLLVAIKQKSVITVPIPKMTSRYFGTTVVFEKLGQRYFNEIRPGKFIFIPLCSGLDLTLILGHVVAG